MCGISGIISVENKKQEHIALLHNIINDQYRRGPDNNNYKIFENGASYCLLGHNRLSIIDLNQNANQPMSDAEQDNWIVFNGEIYNYVELKQELLAKGIIFKTNSDTEVLLTLLKLYGVDAINKLNGMFAFAWYQTSTQTLHLVRDRFGVKPLYFYQTDQTITFASTAKEIAKAYHLKPNYEYIAKGLQYSVFEDDTSISQYANISYLLPGSWLKINYGNAKLNTCTGRYYSLAQNVQLRQDEISLMDYKSAKNLLEEIVSTAVCMRLRADVPIGLSLSGGLDSSAIAALASQTHTNLVAFTFGDKNNYKTEGPLVDQLSKKLNINVVYVKPSIQEIEKSFWGTLEAQDAPFGGPSIIAQNLVYQSAHQHNIKVILGGQGGDESLMGYLKYRVFYLQSLLRQKKFMSAFFYFSTLLPTIWPQIKRAPLLFKASKRYTSKKGIISALHLPEVFINMNVEGGSLVNRQMVDILKTSLPTLLRYEDRNAMYHSIESRLPFLDYRFIEFALALPVSMKLSKGFGKWILRDILKNKIPNSIRMAKYKRGFDVSQNWYAMGLGNIVRQTLNQKKDILQDVFKTAVDIDKEYADTSLSSSFNKFAEATSLIWMFDKL